MIAKLRRLRSLLPALLAVVPIACAALANQPNSPAKKYEYTDLNDPAPTACRYYLLIFGSQSMPKQPRYTHTWVTFVRVGPGSSGTPDIEQHTISWMPATLQIRTWNP